MNQLPAVSEELLQQIRQYAESKYPAEACGLLVDVGLERLFIPCRNNSVKPDQHFILNPSDYVAAKARGAIAAVIHSHPDAFPYPSEADIVHCNRSNFPWFIIGVQKGEADPGLHGFLPTRVKADLEGRPFVHGVQDCYQLVIDYYAQEFGVKLTDYHREDGWWENGDVHLYEDNFEKEGFFPVTLDNIQVGDMIVMQVAAPVANHAGVYVGNEQILHHVYGRLSVKETLTPTWQRRITHIMRHRSRA